MKLTRSPFYSAFILSVIQIECYWLAIKSSNWPARISSTWVVKLDNNNSKLRHLQLSSKHFGHNDVLHLLVEANIHLEFTQIYLPEHVYWDRKHEYTVDLHPDNSWLVSDFLPKLDNKADLNCSESKWGLEANDISNSVLRNVTEKWSRGKVQSLQDLKFEFDDSWSEFGGCITDFEGMDDVPKYLSKSFELYDKYNMNDILRQGNITQGGSYTYQEISDAVSKRIGGKKPLLRCLWNENTNLMILTKITLFFDKFYNIINPISHYYYGMCPKSLSILYSSHASSAAVGSSVIYDNSFDKYPSILDDANGYFWFWQSHLPAICPEQDHTKCYSPKHSWVIESFTYHFAKDIQFTCFTLLKDPHNFKDFNISSLSPIQQEVVDKWGVAKDSWYSDEQAFLYLAWNELGQCSTYFKGIDTAFKFYKKSLELFDKYNMDTILRQSDVHPGKNYTYQEISDATSRGLSGTKPVIECLPFRDEEDGGILMSVGFHLDKYFNPVNLTDFAGSADSPRDCKSQKFIFYSDFDFYVSELKKRNEKAKLKK